MAARPAGSWAAAWPAVAAVGTVAGLVGYALLSNWLMVHAANAPFTVALLFGPLLVAIAGVGLQRRQWGTLAACAVLGAVLVAVVWRGGVQDAQRLYVLQHGAVLLTLAWGFGLTLRGNAKPLITALAEGVHGRLGQVFTPTMARYTRGLTAAWALFFGGLVLLSALLYGLAPWPWWSFYCTVLTPLLSVAAFVGEHFWRYHRHPEFPRVSLRAAFEAYQRHGRPPATP